MKPFQEQTYYEILEIAASATSDEIRSAYARLRTLYADDSVAVYGLADPAQAEALRQRLLEAMEILTDDDLRIEYDRSIGLTSPPPPVAVPAPRDDAPGRAASAELSEPEPAGVPDLSELEAEPERAEGAPPSAERAASAGPSVESERAEAEAANPSAKPVGSERGEGAHPAPGPLSDQSERAEAVHPSSAEPDRPAAAPAVLEPDLPSAGPPAPVSTGCERPPAPLQLSMLDAPLPSAPGVAPEIAAAAPTQLSMLDLLAGAETGHSTHPGYAVSYIPHPPRPVEAVPPSADGSETTETAPALAQAPEPVEAFPASTGGRQKPARTPETAVVLPVEPPPPAPIERPPDPAAAATLPQPPTYSAPPPARPRHLGIAPEIAQETAIDIAESALAQISAKARDSRVVVAMVPAPPPPVEARPKSLEIGADAEFNGELLRQVRQSRGLTLTKLAERTRIAERHLQNIEADRYETLPATVYLRGILMNVARELGLDPLRVSKSYLGLVAGVKK